MKNKLFKPLALLIVLSVCLLAAVGCADGKRATSEELEAAGDIVTLIKTAYVNSGRCEEGTTADKVSIICNGGKPIGPFGDDNNVYVVLLDVEGRMYTDALQEITLGKTSFTLPNGNEPLAWDGDSFISLNSAYTRELITDDDAKIIADLLGINKESAE
ncbi:MAG: hypothetical protein IJO64_04680 [Clostridia bacterium]|nr:hypothetical protein [Clostridia bacterium]MBQ9848333.1 hypothetical protein [Clostridia bacterium]